MSKPHRLVFFLHLIGFVGVYNYEGCYYICCDCCKNADDLVGLQNLGNTCYINTALQCLNSCWELTKYYLDEHYKKNINKNNKFGSKGEVTQAYVEVLENLHKKDGSVYDPGKFKTVVSRYIKIVKNKGQQDTREFLMELLDLLHDELDKGEKNYVAHENLQLKKKEEDTKSVLLAYQLKQNQSIIRDLFYGYETITTENHAQINVYNFNFLDFGIPLPYTKAADLKDCIPKKYKDQTAHFLKIPNILIIRLSRCNETKEVCINFPIKNLDLSDYCDKSFVKDKAVYDLFAIANHRGKSTESGHYYAYCKNHENGKWYEFDDSSVKEIEEENLVTKNAYVLFYKKQGITNDYLEEIYKKDSEAYKKEIENIAGENINVVDNLYKINI